MIICPVLVLAAFAAVPQERPGDVGPEKPLRYRDPWFTPHAGVQADYLGPAVELGDGLAAADFFALADYDKFLRAKDVKGIEGLAAEGRLLILGAGVRLLLVKEHEYRVIGQPSSWEARVLDGPNKDKLVFVRHVEVGRLRPLPVAPGDEATLRPLKPGEPVPVFTSAAACQEFIDAYRLKDSDEIEFKNTVNVLKNERAIILAEEGKRAKFRRIESPADDIAVISEPGDERITTYFTIPSCLGK